MFFCLILIKVQFYRQIFEKFTSTKFREYPSSGSRVIPCRQTDRQRDRHDAGNNHVSQFFKFAKKKKILDGVVIWSMYMAVHVQKFSEDYKHIFLYNFY